MKINLDLSRLEPEEIMALDRLMATSGIAWQAPRYAQALHEALFRQVTNHTDDDGRWVPGAPNVTVLDLPDNDGRPGNMELYHFTIWAMSWSVRMLRQPLLAPRLQPVMAQLTRELYPSFHEMVADNWTARRLVEGQPASRRQARQRSKDLWRRLSRQARRQGVV